MPSKAGARARGPGARKNTVLYAAVLAGCLVVGFGFSRTPLGERVDDIFYDWMTRMSGASYAVSRSSPVIVAGIDEQTLQARGGVRNMRPILTEALDEIARSGPGVVAIDVVLADAGDPSEDARLARALRQIRPLVLSCELVGAKWEDPLPEFRPDGVALGHVHQAQESVDGVNRLIPLEERAGSDRRWALSLEAFAAFEKQPIVESSADSDLEIGKTLIPELKGAEGRPLLIRYVPSSSIRHISVVDIPRYRDIFRGAAVFVGVTALSAARDRLTNSFGNSVPGVEVHAQAFETMMRGQFLSPADDATVLGLCLMFAIAAGLVFAFLPGWWAFSVDVALLASAVLIPLEAFRLGSVFLFSGPVSVALLASASAATFQYFYVRRQLRTSESEKSRYQQAIHWVAHEMRSPLTAIQGSSEIMTRYKLPEEKGRQLSEMINAESKRMARMIQTFLDIERLADGQMELKKEPFEARDVVDACLKRVGPIAERKNIKAFLDTPVEATLTGDRELMEYAFYNLLTNAVKYSPAETEIHVRADLEGGELRLSVRDQGMGMDAHELKNIFKKFYRTKRAEASGEVGTGIGLSIVEQIVTHHNGRMDVTSEPGKGSCFTIVLSASNTKVPPAAEKTAESHNAETFNR